MRGTYPQTPVHKHMFTAHHPLDLPTCASRSHSSVLGVCIYIPQKQYFKEICTPVFTAALFTTAKIQKL